MLKYYPHVTTTNYERGLSKHTDDWRVKSRIALERLKVSRVAGLDKRKREGRFTGHRLLQNASRQRAIGGRLFCTA